MRFPDRSIFLPSVLVTNGFHDLRAISIAKKTGYENVSSVPARTLMPVGIHYTVRKFFGMVEFILKFFLKKPFKTASKRKSPASLSIRKTGINPSPEFGSVYTKYQNSIGPEGSS